MRAHSRGPQEQVAEKKCAASPGGTFRSVFQCLAIFNVKTSDSLSPQLRILTEKLLVAVRWRLQMLAGESLHIVAFASAGTTSRTATDF
jgi:hypothetical protein